MIAASHVSVRKAGGLLLDDIDLVVKRNEFVGVIGPNGAGKTTLMNVIGGYERFAGTLRLFGQEQNWRRSRATRLRIGYVPQLCQLDPAFPILALEAVLTGAVGRLGLFRSPGQAEQAAARRLLEMMRIGQMAERPLGQLSGGERQKVMLARAIIQKPDILLLDEPTANLDIAVQKEVLNLVDEIHRQGSLTILFITHDFNLLPARLERAVFLKQGRKIFDGDVQAALAGESLSRLFDYPLASFEQDGRRFVAYA